MASQVTQIKMHRIHSCGCSISKMIALHFYEHLSDPVLTHYYVGVNHGDW